MPGLYQVKVSLIFPMIEYFENNEHSRPQIRILVNGQILAVFNEFT